MTCRARDAVSSPRHDVACRGVVRGPAKPVGAFSWSDDPGIDLAKRSAVGQTRSADPVRWRGPGAAFYENRAMHETRIRSAGRMTFGGAMTQVNGAAHGRPAIARVWLIGLLVCAMSVTESAWGQRPPSDPVQDLVLVGVVVGRSSGPVAALRDRRTGREAWYRVGDRIEDSMLSAVSSDRVVLRRAERDIELRLSASQGGGDGRVGAAPPGRRVRGRPIPAGASTPPYRSR